MTGVEFKTRRVQLWGTQVRAAAALGVTIQAVKNYEHGRRGISETVVRLIECLEDKKGK